jgi:hypothetical protein
VVEPGVVGAEECDELLHPPTKRAIVTANVTVGEIPVQRRDPRAEARVMDAERTPAMQRNAPSRLAERVAELEQMLATLARARSTAGTDTRPLRFEGDPVALSQALHPDGLRRVRRAAAPVTPRGAGSMPVRLVVFDGSPRT